MAIRRNRIVEDPLGLVSTGPRRLKQPNELWPIPQGTSPVGCGVTAFSPLTQCTEFDGGEHCLASNYTSNLAFQYDDPFTLGVWMKRNGYPTHTEVLHAAYYYAAAVGWNWGLFPDAANPIGGVYVILRQSNSVYVTANIRPPWNVDIFDYEWHLVVVTYDGSAQGSGFDFYVDGALEETTKAAATNGAPTIIGYNASCKFNIARRGGGSDFYEGRMCHPFVLSKQLTSDGVSCLYSLSKPIDLASHPDIESADIEQWVRLGEGDTVGVNAVQTLASGASNLSTFSMEASDFQIADVPP